MFYVINDKCTIQYFLTDKMNLEIFYKYRFTIIIHVQKYCNYITKTVRSRMFLFLKTKLSFHESILPFVKRIRHGINLLEMWAVSNEIKGHARRKAPVAGTDHIWINRNIPLEIITKTQWGREE